MSWGLAANWLAVIGLLLLTFGTGVQAWANLAEFKSVKKTVSTATVKALADAVAGADLTGGLGFFFLRPRKLAQLAARDPGEAVELARFLRLAEVWSILMVGSGLALAAAVIQLILAYP
jgi:hypothetical protein